MSAREAGLVGHENETTILELYKQRYFRDSDIFVFILSAVQEAFVFMSFFLFWITWTPFFFCLQIIFFHIIDDGS